MSALPDELLAQVAECFRLLGEPARLRVVNALREHRELTVTQLVELTGLGQANLSKHLQLLHAAAFVSRRREGLYVWYAIADRETIELCDVMCARLEREAGLKHQPSPA
ncbi:MAG TPA: metalloregulator ArsR/SmtB family transcription factor [Gemmatimonadales bacterium]|nr:metalloregulator ArsR/SmtB family transcription factor [Gemmatimonadales bacterium]